MALFGFYLGSMCVSSWVLFFHVGLMFGFILGLLWVKHVLSFGFSLGFYFGFYVGLALCSSLGVMLGLFGFDVGFIWVLFGFYFKFDSVSIRLL